MKIKFLLTFALCGSFLLGFSQATKVTALKVGAAKSDVTPAQSALPQGYSNIHDKLFCRAVVIDDGSTSAALISIDQGMVSNDIYNKVTKQIEKEFGIPAMNIFISASHTHSAPRGGADVEQGVINAVKEAKAKLKPAKASYHTGSAFLNINRDVINPVTRLWSQGPNYDGPSDKTVAVIKFTDLSGELMAVYYNYAMHANTMFMSGAISADFPGETSKYLEEFYHNNVVALFSSGAAGDQNPVSVRPMSDVSRRKTDALLASGKAKDLNEAIMMAGFGGQSDLVIDKEILTRQAQMITSLGQMLGEEILRAMSVPQKEDAAMKILSSQKVVTCPGRTRTNTGREGTEGTYVDGDPVNIKLSLLQLGDISLAGVNAEVYTPIALRLKKESPNNYTIFSSITNGSANSGYIPSDDAFQRYTFQVLSSRLKPNCAENAIVDGLVDMMDKMK
jgi:neutral ceramidase